MATIKPMLIRRSETNRIRTSSGEFLEYISWRENKDLAVGIGVHNSRFPRQGYIISKKVDEAVLLLKGKGAVVVIIGGKELRMDLEKDAVAFIPKNTPFYFDPSPKMEIFSATGPAWYPKQQQGLDYRRKQSGRMII
ncbi:MAG: hypothetical protein AABX47_02015 [Nanoarchaeota archaeon]